MSCQRLAFAPWPAWHRSACVGKTKPVCAGCSVLPTAVSLVIFGHKRIEDLKSKHVRKLPTGGLHAALTTARKNRITL